jgi:hypothetical protein
MFCYTYCNEDSSLLQWSSSRANYSAGLATFGTTALLTYLRTPHSTVVLEKLTGLQPVKKLPAFYETQSFIPAFISARYLSLSWASSIQSTPPHPTSWRSILIVSSHQCLDLPRGLFLSGFLTKILCTPLPSPSKLHAPPIRFFSILLPIQQWVRCKDNVVFSTPLLPRSSQTTPFNTLQTFL